MSALITHNGLSTVTLRNSGFIFSLYSVKLLRNGSLKLKAKPAFTLYVACDKQGWGLVESDSG